MPDATACRREAMRLLLWLHYQAPGQEVRSQGCERLRGLHGLPAEHPGAVDLPGSGPARSSGLGFRGPLSHKSHRQAVVIVASLFPWLQATHYLTANPWVLASQKTGTTASKTCSIPRY